MAAASAVAEQVRADAHGLASELTVILATAGVQVAVQAALWLALSLVMPRPAGVLWTALVPGACLFAAGFQGFTLAVSVYFAPRAAGPPRSTDPSAEVVDAVALELGDDHAPQLEPAAGRLHGDVLVQDQEAGVGGRHPPLGDQLVPDRVDRVEDHVDVGEGR